MPSISFEDQVLGFISLIFLHAQDYVYFFTSVCWVLLPEWVLHVLSLTRIEATSKLCLLQR